MNVTEVTSRIKKLPLFKDLVLDLPSTDSQHGRINVPTRHFKDSGKNEYKLGDNYGLFVAHMYGGTDKEFFYILFNRRAEKRDFRKHQFYTIEWNRIFASGYSVDKVLADLEKQLIGYELI